MKNDQLISAGEEGSDGPAMPPPSTPENVTDDQHRTSNHFHDEPLVHDNSVHPVVTETAVVKSDTDAKKTQQAIPGMFPQDAAVTTTPKHDETSPDENFSEDPLDFVSLPEPLPEPSPRSVVNSTAAGTPGAFAVQTTTWNPPRRMSPDPAPVESTQGIQEAAIPFSPVSATDGLVEAQPVPEEDPDTPHAVPFDHSKTGAQPCTRSVILAVLVFGFLVVAGTVVGATCGSGLCQSQETMSLVPGKNLSSKATSAPTTYYRDPLEATNIEWEIKYVLGRDYFEINNTTEDMFQTEARQKALHWILYDDPLQLDASTSQHLIQRFILVVLYYYTAKQVPWAECNPSPNQGSEFCYYSENYLEATPQSSTTIWGNRWLSISHECQWAGVSCHGVDDTVTVLELTYNGLNGPLPWELAKLTALDNINLRANSLTGSLPTELGLLHAVHILTVGENHLQGTVPLELLYSKRIRNDNDYHYLHVFNNMFTGTLPEDIGRIQWNSLRLSGNLLSGSLPQALFASSYLLELDLGGNAELSGTIPPIYSPPAALETLSAKDTSLAGTIPSELALAPHLVELNLANTNMHGTLPEEIFHSLLGMEYLDLSDCNFSGTISSSLGLWTALVGFDVARNHFSGALPQEIRSLTLLGTIALNGNNFTDEEVPDSWCALRVQKSYYEWRMTADCLPDDTTGVPVMACPENCCTHCCNPNTNICQDKGP